MIVTTAVPTFFAVIFPDLLTVTTFLLDVLHEAIWSPGNVALATLITLVDFLSCNGTDVAFKVIFVGATVTTVLIVLPLLTTAVIVTFTALPFTTPALITPAVLTDTLDGFETMPSCL